MSKLSNEESIENEQESIVFRLSAKYVRKKAIDYLLINYTNS